MYALSVGWVLCWGMSFLSSTLVTLVAIVMVLSSGVVRAALCAVKDPRPNPFTTNEEIHAYDEMVGTPLDEYAGDIFDDE